MPERATAAIRHAIPIRIRFIVMSISSLGTASVEITDRTGVNRPRVNTSIHYTKVSINTFVYSKLDLRVLSTHFSNNQATDKKIVLQRNLKHTDKGRSQTVFFSS